MIDVVGTAVIHGFSTQLVNVEAHMSSGIPQINVIGLADQTIREAKERLVIALLEQGIKLGNRKYIVSLNPTDIKKQGGHLDLPIAIALLKASKLLPKSNLKIGALGGLSLSGQLTETNEIFSLLSVLVDERYDYIIVPKSAIHMKKFFNNVSLLGLSHLSEVIEFLSHEDSHLPVAYSKWLENFEKEELSLRPLKLSPQADAEMEELELDFVHVKGQELAKRAIVIALAGHHHLLLYGPPGTGKSMLASRIPSIQQVLEDKGLYECLSMRSRAGFPLDFDETMKEPFRMPHTGVSASAMLGGMQANMLGEAPLAHRGVLFMDEMPEFKRDVIEGLRGPLETGRIFLSKTHYKGEIPANFILVATANPCPCGYHGFSERCNCSERDIRRYFSKLSGPILDRFDLKIQVAFKDCGPEEERHKQNDKDEEVCLDSACGLSSKDMLKAISKARQIQKDRYNNEEVHNGNLEAKDLSLWCKLDEKSLDWMKKNIKIKSGEDSMRFYNKILKVSRTIADLEGSKDIDRKHLIEAFYYNRRKII